MKRCSLTLLLVATGCAPVDSGDVGEVPIGPGPDAGPPPVLACESMAGTTLDDFERLFIVPRCGTAMCHGPSSVFPPRDLDKPSKIRFNLVGAQGALNCKNDYYVNRVDPIRSYLLATVDSDSNQVTCPSGGPGGTRMPNKDGMPTVQGEKLTNGELECLREWVFTIAKQ